MKRVWLWVIVIVVVVLLVMVVTARRTQENGFDPAAAARTRY